MQFGATLINVLSPTGFSEHFMLIFCEALFNKSSFNIYLYVYIKSIWMSIYLWPELFITNMMSCESFFKVTKLSELKFWATKSHQFSVTRSSLLPPCLIFVQIVRNNQLKVFGHYCITCQCALNVLEPVFLFCFVLFCFVLVQTILNSLLPQVVNINYIISFM